MTVQISCLMHTPPEHITELLYTNTVLGTLAVDGWAVTFGTARRGLRAAAPPSPLLAVPNVTAHLSTASLILPTLYCSMWQSIGVASGGAVGAAAPHSRCSCIHVERCPFKCCWGWETAARHNAHRPLHKFKAPIHSAPPAKKFWLRLGIAL